MSRLWDIVDNRQRIEPWELQEAVEEQLGGDEWDYRTRLLIHESADLLRRKFKIFIDCGDLDLEPGRKGFPSLERTVGAITRPETIKRFLQELGSKLTESAEITVGGSSALILLGLLLRLTHDVDVVDEVPAALRSLRITSETKLYIAHFQSHYLPEGWQTRRQSLGDFRRLRVFLVDGIDIFVGKLFSSRQKDMSDVYHLRRHFALDSVREHLLRYGRKLASDPKLRDAADRNWYVNYSQEQLPEGL